MGTETTRITIRVPNEDLAIIDGLVEAGEFTNRTAVVRRALRDLIRSKGPEMVEAAKSKTEITEALLQMQEMKEQMRKQQQMLEKLMKK